MNHFHTTNYSDDCCSFHHDGKNVAHRKKNPGPDESATWGVWWPMYVDGVHVADIMTEFQDGWEFHVKMVDGHDLDVRYPRDSMHVNCDDEWCCFNEDDCPEAGA